MFDPWFIVTFVIVFVKEGKFVSGLRCWNAIKYMYKTEPCEDHEFMDGVTDLPLLIENQFPLKRVSFVTEAVSFDTTLVPKPLITVKWHSKTKIIEGLTSRSCWIRKLVNFNVTDRCQNNHSILNSSSSYIESLYVATSFCPKVKISRVFYKISVYRLCNSTSPK